MVAFANPHQPSRTEITAARFPLGETVKTHGVLALEQSGNIKAHDFLRRHAAGDWGDCSAEDKQSNEQALKPESPDRLVSSYRLKGSERSVFVITEADRSVTTVLLSEEY